MSLSYWLDLPAPPPVSLVGDARCDVLVIGGGLCGTSAALSLARAGVSVILLEADRVAGAATGRNAGFILQGTAERYARAIVMMGRARASAIHAWTLENHRLIRAFVEESGLDCGYQRRGSLQLADSPEEEAELIESASLLVEDGFQAELITESALDAVYRDAGWHMGVRLPEDGEVQPVRLVRGAADAARTAGAKVYENSRVLSLDASQMGEVRAHTANGDVSAQVALVCTNAAVRQLLPWYADKVDPVRGQMLATGPAPQIFAQPVYANHGFDYWRQDEHGRIALGGWRNLDPGTEVGFDDALHPGIQGRMEEFLQRFPALRGVPVTHRWSGTMGFSRDGLPLIGPAPGAPGALAAVGFTGHGFGFAWLAGVALAEVALCGSHPFATELSPRRMA